MDKREQLLRAKIPCPETGIEIRHTVCAICSPAYNCGVDAYVKDGKLLKVEGMDGHPRSKGGLCTKGLANRGFIYRPDRILTPLRRVGKRGEGRFEPITWDEAYDEISKRLLALREEFGADCVAFFGGYNKWYRPWLRRFAHSFGTYNYGTESSTCMTAGWMAWKIASGQLARPDMAHCDLYLGWAFNPYYSGYLNAQAAEKRKAEGMKIIVVDPRITPTTEKLADLHLRPRPGTDGALALCMGNTLIEKGWVDKDFIARHVHGFAEYAAYAKGFNKDNVEKLTGVPYADVLKACQMIHESKTMGIQEDSAPIPHHRNGLQNYRAIMALSALTGNYDREGGQIPAVHTFTHQISGYTTLEEEWMDATAPEHVRPAVGEERFPLWFHTEREMQTVDLARQILEEKPYPVKAVFGMGVNYRMLPEDGEVRRALEKVDFFVNTDLFMTDTCKLADIVLPVCSSFERGELETYGGGYAWLTKPAIDRIGQSKSDVEIIQELSIRMNLGDEELAAGYEANIAYMLAPRGITLEELKASDVPIKVPGPDPYAVGTRRREGLGTAMGKFELYSELIAAHPEWGLEALPTYVDPLDDADETVYPYTLCSGGRLPNALHSRLHKVKFTRSLRPEPTADLSLEDAEALGLKAGDDMELYTARGSLTVKANPTHRVSRGVVFFYHGYSEADVNALMSKDHVDPYSGFPAYNATRCGMRKKVEA